MTSLIVTVDTEAYRVGGTAPPFDQHIYGTCDGRRWGVDTIMDVCEAAGGKATFFVDFCMRHEYGDEAVRDLCQHLDGRGHDVQVHTHPNWMAGHERTTMHSYPYETQRGILEDCRERYEAWLGRPPLAFRAGAYGASLETLRALEATGFRVDSSYFRGNRNCVLSRELSHRHANRVFRIGEIVEIPVTIYTLALGRFTRTSKIDIDACSFSEIRRILDLYASEPDVQFVILFLHSFSFVRQGDRVEDVAGRAGRVRKFERTMELVREDPRFEVLTLAEFHTRMIRQEWRQPATDVVRRLSPALIVPRLLGRWAS